MKTTFSRTFTAAAVVLLAATLQIGISFQMLVKDYLTKQTMSGLKVRPPSSCSPPRVRPTIRWPV